MRSSFILFSFLAAACSQHVGGGQYAPDAGSGPDGAPGFDAPPTDAAPLCGGQYARVTMDPMPPTVQIAIDASGSMNSDFGGVSRWQAVVGALSGPSGVVARLDADVRFGATVFNSHGGSAGGACPDTATIPPAFANAAPISMLLAQHQPKADTPTAETITQLTAALAPVPAGRRTVLLLATDGDPDNCNDPDAHDLESKIRTEDAIEVAYAAGIETFVLSVGTDATAEHLQRAANLGRGAPAHIGTEPYYVATNPDELVAAFEEMITGVIPTCAFTIAVPISQTQAAAGEVSLDGAALVPGTDWRWIDEHTIELLGAACEQALDENAPHVTGEFPCE